MTIGLLKPWRWQKSTMTAGGKGNCQRLSFARDSSMANCAGIHEDWFPVNGNSKMNQAEGHWQSGAKRSHLKHSGVWVLSTQQCSKMKDHCQKRIGAMWVFVTWPGLHGRSAGRLHLDPACQACGRLPQNMTQRGSLYHQMDRRSLQMLTVAVISGC